MTTQNLTRAQKISATKKTQAANLSSIEKLQKRVQRNPRLLDLCHEIDKILATLSILAYKSLQNKSIESEISDWNEVHTNNLIKFDEQWSSLTIQYSSTELTEKFGRDGYKLWKSLFKQISKGGIDKNRNAYFSTWSVNLTTYDLVQKEINLFLKEHKLNKITHRDLAFIHVMSDMDIESLEFTTFEVVAVDHKQFKIGGKKGSKKIVNSVERNELKSKRKKLKEKTALEFSKKTSSEKREYLNNLQNVQTHRSK
jgi:hypothetical protein